MESVEQFERSFKELGTMKKAISTDKMVINFKDLDGTTAGMIREAILPVIVQRSQDIQKVILGVQ